MDAFLIHDRLIKDYKAFTEGFVEIRDERIARRLEEETAKGAQWPAPFLALNPAFQAGGRIDELVDKGLLVDECSKIFRSKRDESDSGTTPITLHQHQRDAVEVARTGASYVLTTGTGSGKSLSYIVPIVDAVLREGSGKGIKAIIVYPMNALANSQKVELEKFLQYGYGYANRPVTFDRYTGQEDDEERDRILKNPPDILLTNYVMLDLLITRPHERKFLAQAAQGLRFLVLDELHTYRGRQGADVAMLVRRARETCEAHDTLQCIGTSATMASGDTVAEQRAEVARVATQIFGTTVDADNVITETLVRATGGRSDDKERLTAAVQARGDAEARDPALAAPFSELRNDALTSWIETEFGLEEEHESGTLLRKTPQTIDDAARRLSETTAQPVDDCATAIRATLLAGSQCKDEQTGRPLFAFRLHQFLSKGGTIFTTLADEDHRDIETDYQVVLPGEPERRLFPLAFCRECGKEYLMASYDQAKGEVRARHTLRPSEDDDGYLYISTSSPWPANPIPASRLPSSWIESTPAGPRVIRSRTKNVPYRLWLSLDGSASKADENEGNTLAAWIPRTFRFCLECGVSYEAPRTNEFAKLVTLDREGRSSAMSVISSSVLKTLRAMPEGELPDEARKLLAFVDNRQDASLQAGHFNDFVQVVQLRAAIYNAALEAANQGRDGLTTDELGPAVLRHLQLQREDYSEYPDAIVGQHRVQRALRNAVEYRAMHDLQASWRVTMPNLERTGVLVIDYPDVAELAAVDEAWRDSHPLLATAEPGPRREIAEVLLNEMRRVLAISSHVLTQDYLDRLKRESEDQLRGLWSVSYSEPDIQPGLAIVGPGASSAGRNRMYLSGRGAYGRWLRNREYWGSDKLTVDDGTDIIAALVKVLTNHGILSEVTLDDSKGYQVNHATMVLRPGAGDHATPDPIRHSIDKDRAPRVIPFFRDLYRDTGQELAGLLAREHTAQVRAEDRQELEERFGKAKTLPLLYCSPTMELGVDIRSLIAVAMRNVPPTPANYAQRSGRAGRSGQPALVVTYCSSGNSHDSYYFKRPHLMVSGKVQPPRLDVANEDLVRSHVQAIWLAQTGADLGRSMVTVLDLATPGYPIDPKRVDVLSDPGAGERAAEIARTLLAPLVPDLSKTPWWHDGWVDEVISGAVEEFDKACQRWRDLYEIAETERKSAEATSGDASLPRKAREEADRRRYEARQRMELLLNESDESGQADFYTYRYFASEGFLPGYSFPRLPLAAYVPGMRGSKSGVTWLQRPRFLAISEFGPGALIYHEGARYQVTRINLPRSGDGTGPAKVVRDRARVCNDCGYYHPREAGTDVCESCGSRDGRVLNDLLHMQTVITRRRERISADEEERNRVGFELATTYRFAPRGGLPGRLEAAALGEAGNELATILYGDSAELRVINLGRKRRKRKEEYGFWLDLVEGKWLSEKQALDGSDEDDQLEVDADDVKRKVQVIPYVRDRRNVVVFRWHEELTDEQRYTLQFAIERGIEAEFELEDSELTSQELPDNDGKGRFLLVEAAEGGAGVLRRIQAEEDALKRAAARALKIIHVNPDTGKEEPGACVRGCYQCLLSYGNQMFHEVIDRRTIRDLLMSLVRGRTESAPASTTNVQPTWNPSDHVGVDDRANALLETIKRSGGKEPDRSNTDIAGIRVDAVYESALIPTVIVLDRDDQPSVDVAPLLGEWNVIRIKPDDDIADVVNKNLTLFQEAGQ